jgi:inhibitor of KinA sporulation pathway (predicted exonuclease)
MPLTTLIIDIEATCWKKLPLDGTHHRGGDDARNIARILASTLARRGADALRLNE